MIRILFSSFSFCCITSMNFDLSCSAFAIPRNVRDVMNIVSTSKSTKSMIEMVARNADQKICPGVRNGFVKDHAAKIPAYPMPETICEYVFALSKDDASSFSWAVNISSMGFILSLPNGLHEPRRLPENP